MKQEAMLRWFKCGSRKNWWAALCTKTKRFCRIGSSFDVFFINSVMFDDLEKTCEFEKHCFNTDCKLNKTTKVSLYAGYGARNIDKNFENNKKFKEFDFEKTIDNWKQNSIEIEKLAN